MKYYWSGLVLTLMLLMLVVPSKGQDLLQTLQKSRAAYQQQENYYGEITNKIFSQESPDVLQQTSLLTIRKRGAMFWYDMGEIEMLLNAEYLINLNTAENVLVCNRVSIGENQIDPMLDDLEQIVAGFSKVTYKGLTKNSHCYILHNENGPINLLELYFDQNHHLLNKAVYHYNSDYDLGASRLEVTCKHLDLSPQFSAALFSEERFVQVEAAKVWPQKKYQTYTLILGEGLEYVNQ